MYHVVNTTFLGYGLANRKSLEGTEYSAIFGLFYYNGKKHVNYSKTVKIVKLQLKIHICLFLSAQL